MTATVILGGGFGGLACARALRGLLPEEHRITLVDKAPGFLVGAAKAWVMTGERRPDTIVRPRAALLPPGISLLQAEALSLDPARRRVETTAGTLEGDFLVVALGAELDMGAVPGLEDAAHSFYTLVAAMRLHDALEEFDGGRVVLLVPRTPIKCPPAPYETAMLLHAYFERRGMRGRVALELWTVERSPVPTAGPEAGRRLTDEIAACSVALHTGRKAVEADAGARWVRFEDGMRTSYDLLIAVPPHRPPRVVVEAGLAEATGWIPVDAATLEVRGHAGGRVYALGDVAAVPLPGRYDDAQPLALPKAGVFAAAHGEVAARRIAAAALGQAPDAVFGGEGYCYVETGRGRAMRAGGSFFALPHPAVSLAPADEVVYREKLAWVERWLTPAS